MKKIGQWRSVFSREGGVLELGGAMLALCLLTYIGQSPLTLVLLWLPLLPPHPLILYIHLYYYTLLVKGSVGELTHAEPLQDVVLMLLCCSFSPPLGECSVLLLCKLACKDY